MTRSIFDPTGNETEHSGSRNLGPDAREISHMPPDLGDTKTDIEDENLVIDLGRLQPATPKFPDETLSETADAPQEPDQLDDPRSLLEGQPSDDSEAPQEQPQ